MDGAPWELEGSVADVAALVAAPRMNAIVTLKDGKTIRCAMG
jgi:hypothetical protein